MINRQLIRIKVLQTLYTYYHASSMTSEGAHSTLDRSMDASYRLYIYLCGLPIRLSQIADQALEAERSRFYRREEYIRAYEGLSSSSDFVRYMESDITFMDQWESMSVVFDRREIDDYLRSAVAAMVEDTVRSQSESGVERPLTRSRWCHLIEEHILRSEAFEELLSQADFYLNDDITIVYSFVLKAYKAQSTTGLYSEIIKPQYSSSEVYDFAHELLTHAMTHKEEYRTRISRYFKNWDADRVSETDYLILQLAVTEAAHFPSTPTRVIINEYLNLSHDYSAVGHHTFTNGILHALFRDMQAEGLILGE